MECGARSGDEVAYDARRSTLDPGLTALGRFPFLERTLRRRWWFFGGVLAWCLAAWRRPHGRPPGSQNRPAA